MSDAGRTWDESGPERLYVITGGRYYGAGWFVSLVCAVGILYFIRRRRGGGLTDPGHVGHRGPRH